MVRIFMSGGDNKNPKNLFSRTIQRAIFSWRSLLALLLFIFIIIAFVLNREGVFAPENILRILQIHPFVTPVFFVALFVLMSLLLLPTLPLNLLAGFLWGPYWGALFSVTGATTGALCAFLFSRNLANDFCKRQFHNPAWSWLQGEIKRRGWKAVAFVRVSSVFPSGPLNYYFGITPVPLHTFAWSTALFFIPPAFLIASIGHWMGWGAFTGSAQNLIHAIVMISAIITLMLIVTVILKKWLKKKPPKIS